ncbi:Membrane protein TerC, possibly involved in tellurium resistance [Ekhidna lutea]|uniref:Membrane protein TerC, possibly involved in tellurium resistance n=1 Tax=Ekhidna lutea TaxID=447679 RepID=A0A239JF10_EKHLU|nr:tellurium resistance protein TerC [Ekhidna lutea]SNT04192.1 Membrane protein TerC, possibly involved in tellurium resistance [Ekhidna lutea]
MAENIFTLIMLIILQAVLGFDNLLYISLESKRAPAEKQKMVRSVGIGIAIALRIILLYVLVNVIQYFQEPFLELDSEFLSGAINVHSLIVLFGGAFILYTAVKEIFHLVYLEEHEGMEQRKQSTTKTIMMIVLMNLIFSFDSILSAMALSDVFWVMAAAIVVSGGLMIWLSDGVSTFLAKNRLYEVLGLFILFLVGVMLLSEGGHLAHLKIYRNPITPMSKTTFYFIIAILVVIDILQGRYQKKLLSRKKGVQ